MAGSVIVAGARTPIGRLLGSLKGFAARLSAPQLERLRSDPDVAFVSADRPVEAVAAVPLASGETAPTGVRRIVVNQRGRVRVQ